MLFSDGVDHNDKMQPFLTAFYKSFVPTAILLPIFGMKFTPYYCVFTFSVEI